MTTTKKKLQKLPGRSVDVREVVGLRMLKMARPICPNSKVEMEIDPASGAYKRKVTTEVNCQREGGKWWEACAERGHDPYWATVVSYSLEDDLEEMPDGRMRVLGQYRVATTVRRPNLAQVAIAKNINNGRGPIDAYNVKGFRYLSDIGFDECCQFRNCQEPVDERWVIDNARDQTGLGRYCSEKHLALVVQTHRQDDGAPGILLPGPKPSAAARIRVAEERKELLAKERLLASGALDD